MAVNELHLIDEEVEQLLNLWLPPAAGRALVIAELYDRHWRLERPQLVPVTHDAAPVIDFAVHCRAADA
jgi:hypothetical protein